MRLMKEIIILFFFWTSAIQMREDENQYIDDNKLDMAFIAEDSRQVRSVSISGSEAQSMSAVSRINANHLSNSPFLNFQPEISNMSQWPIDDVNIFGRKIRKRKSQAIVEEIQESNQDEREIEKMSKCTKKRLGEKMKVITIGRSTANYSLRSKKAENKLQPQGRNLSPEDNSSDEIRNIVNQIDGKTEENGKAKRNNIQYNSIF